MVEQKISIHTRSIEPRLKSVLEWDISEEDKTDLLLFVRELGLGKVNRGKKISESRQLKYLDGLKPLFIFFDKPIGELLVSDMEKFDLALSQNKITRVDQKSYSEETKRDLKKMLKIYLKWKFKTNPAYYAELTSWLDVRLTVKKTPQYLNEVEIEKLYKSCKSTKERFLIAILFDSGARAEEFMNIRYEDLMFSQSANYYQLTLKEEYSKTCGRTIGLYWKYSVEVIKEYLAERIEEGIKPKDPVFSGSYDGARQFICRLGAKVLKKHVHFHLFRHSSATYYANKLNRQELCYRYGWKFSSDMPDTYISRSGMVERQVEEKIFSTQLTELNKRLEELNQKNRLMADKINLNEQQNKIISNKLNVFLEIFKDNREILKPIIVKNKEKILALY